MSYTYISDGVCIIDCKTYPGDVHPLGGVCDGDCDKCLMYLDYQKANPAPANRSERRAYARPIDARRVKKEKK